MRSLWHAGFRLERIQHLPQLLVQKVPDFAASPEYQALVALTSNSLAWYAEHSRSI